MWNRLISSFKCLGAAEAELNGRLGRLVRLVRLHAHSGSLELGKLMFTIYNS